MATQTQAIQHALGVLLPIGEAIALLQASAKDIAELEKQVGDLKAVEAKQVETGKALVAAKAELEQTKAKAISERSEAQRIRNEAVAEANELTSGAKAKATAIIESEKEARQHELRDLQEQIEVLYRDRNVALTAAAKARQEHDAVLDSMDALKRRLA